jgi:hypothetical protein
MRTVYVYPGERTDFADYFSGPVDLRSGPELLRGGRPNATIPDPLEPELSDVDVDAPAVTPSNPLNAPPAGEVDLV